MIRNLYWKIKFFIYRNDCFERTTIKLPKELFNEAAKPPYEKLFKMTDFGNMLYKALDEANLKPQFHLINGTSPLEFDSIEIWAPKVKVKV
jgi:hypothetical protein